jgi:hypothetical protein
MAFNWNFKRQPDLTNYIGAQIDPYNASRIASENMQGYRPNAAFTPGTPAEQAAAAMQGYTQNPQGGQFSVPNDMHGGMGQPDLEGYGESLQAASDAAAQAQAKEQQIADIESQIATLEKRIAEKTAKLQNFAGNADQIAAIEARKINGADPTAIWRWKVDRDEAKRIANAQNKPNDTARANALIEATNTIENMVVDPSMDTPTKNAMLSKLADIKSNLQKNGLPTKMVDDKMSEIKGENKQVAIEQPETDKPEDFEFEGTDREQGEARATRILQKDPEKLTQNEITTLKRDIQSGKISVSNETKNKIDKIHSQIIDRDKKRVEADKKEERLLKKGKNLSSDDLEFLKGRKGLKHHTDSYGNEWYTRG